MATDKKRKPRRKKVIKLDYNGELLTVNELAKRLGISSRTLYYRYKNIPKDGWFNKKAIGKKILITYQGETKTISDWSATLGIKPKTIRCRLAKDWPPELVLSREKIKREKPKKSTKAENFSIGKDNAPTPDHLTPEALDPNCDPLVYDEDLELKRWIYQMRARGLSDEEILAKRRQI